MPEAVIVDAIRSPIGRAFKGSLVGIRPDDLGAYVVNALLERNEGLDRDQVDDLVCGCGIPQGEQSFNIGRVISLLSDLPEHGGKLPSVRSDPCREWAVSGGPGVFRLSKWYMDCVAPDGTAVLAYWARLTWGLLRLRYAAVLFRQDNTVRETATLCAGSNRGMGEAPASEAAGSL